MSRRTGFALRIFLEREEGPLDEKYAIVGAGLYCDTTVLGRIVATGFLGKYKIYQKTSCHNQCNEFVTHTVTGKDSTKIIACLTWSS